MDKKEIAYTLLESLYRDKGIAKHLIESYNSFVDITLRKIVLNEYNVIEPLILPQGVEEVRINFKEIKVLKPHIEKFRGVFAEVYPLEARLRGLTYQSPIIASMELIEDGKVVDEKDIFIGYIPTMVKSKYCWLNGLNEEELIKLGEDPKDPGGYFIVNGNERVIVGIEELMPNKMILEEGDDPRYPWVLRIFSERGQYRVLHLLEKSREGIVYLTFGRIKKIPIIIILKALGIDREDMLYEIISEGDENLSTDLYINFLEAQEIQTTEDALEYLGKLLGLTTKKRRVLRAQQLLDTLLLPHIGQSEDKRIEKLFFLAKATRRLLYYSYGKENKDDVDHLAFKKIRGVGELLGMVFRYAFASLVFDIRKNYEKLVKKGKRPNLIGIVRPDILTSKILSSIATGNWPGDRTGVSQFIQKTNFNELIAYLHRVKSPLEEKRENFEARDLHGTHWGRYCAAETPDSIVIGLRKNLSIGAEITPDIKFDENQLIQTLEKEGLLTSLRSETQKIIENLKTKNE